MRIIADLHLHSPYSRATSKRLSPSGLEAAARLKGIDLIGSGDACHPAWLDRLSRELQPAEEGFFKLRLGATGTPSGTELAKNDHFQGCLAFDQPRFVLSAEIATIYKTGDRTKRIHHLVLLPDFETAHRLQTRLSRYGKLDSDGRPIIHLDSRDLLELVLETEALSPLVPAHIWTPWYSVLGNRSGFDSIEECYRDLSPLIGSIETGLSSDPPMNWAVSSLDRFAIISNSDAHSPENLGREATVFEMEPTFHGLVDALSGARGGPRGRVAGSIEFFPEGGKYHGDGHRDCGVSLLPAEAEALGRLCPVCGKPLTIGVLHRVLDLADRSIEEMEALSLGAKSEGKINPRLSDEVLSQGLAHTAQNRRPFHRLIPLKELLSELLGVKAASRKVDLLYGKLVIKPGGELGLLAHLPIYEVENLSAGLLPTGLLAEALRRMRSGKIIAEPGSDGKYGRIRLFASGELE